MPVVLDALDGPVLRLLLKSSMKPPLHSVHVNACRSIWVCLSHEWQKPRLLLVLVPSDSNSTALFASTKIGLELELLASLLISELVLLLMTASNAVMSSGPSLLVIVIPDCAVPIPLLMAESDPSRLDIESSCDCVKCRLCLPTCRYSWLALPCSSFRSRGWDTLSYLRTYSRLSY